MELDVVWSLSFDHLTYRSFFFSLDSTYTYRRRRHSPHRDEERHSTHVVSTTTTHRMRTIVARISRRAVSRLLASVNPIHLDTKRSLNHYHPTRQLEVEFEKGT